MGRPRIITDEEILAAARPLFVVKGIGATADEVAARCGVSEATVFRRFPTKKALFAAALAKEGIPQWAQRLGERAGRPDLHRTLVELGAEILDYGKKVLPLWMMTLSNAGDADRRKRRSLALGMVASLTELFAVESRAGRLRLPDPAVAARIFLGTLLGFALLKHWGGNQGAPPPRRLLEGLAHSLCPRRGRPRSR
jgi:AcrR family transcriptional regulator